MIVLFWHILMLLVLRKIDYIGKIDWITYFVIHRSLFSADYEKYKVLIGPLIFLRNVRVIDIERYRDGGSIDIETSAGDFRFPIGAKKTAYFNELEIKRF